MEEREPAHCKGSDRESADERPPLFHALCGGEGWGEEVLIAERRLKRRF
jgi:hypothetical protein